MTTAQRAIVLSRADVPGAADLMVHSCEDCACPVSTATTPARPRADPGTGPWVRARDVISMKLDGEHRLLFNPLGRGGAVVVNGAAGQIADRLTQPAGAAELRAAFPAADLDEALRRLIELEIIHPAGTAPRPEFGQSDVLTAWLHVTNACNLRCPYCYVHKTPEGMDEATGRAAVEAVVASAATHGFRAVKLKYAGGEASLNYQLMMDLHAYAGELTSARGLELQATLLTNGVRLRPALADWLRDAGIRVMISLDGVGQTHDAQRPFADGRPSFLKVEKTIEQLVGQGLAPHLSITITGPSAGGVADAVRFALERELTFSLNFFRDNDCAATAADLRYEEREMIAGLRAAFGVVEEYLPRWSVLGAVLDRGQLMEPRQRSCGVGQDYVVIDQRGGVAKCHMEIEQTLGDVFTGDPLALVRRDRTGLLNLISDEKEGCRDCTWRYWCSGGCSAATFRATGRFDIKSPNCGIYKAIYPDALRLEGLRLLKYAVC